MLESINLEGTSLRGEGVLELAKGLEKNESLIYMNLKRNNIECEKAAGRLIRNLPIGLLELDLSRNKLGDIAISEMCQNF